MYIAIEIQKNENVTVEEGRVITRIFEDNTQTCIIKLEKNSNVIIECEKKIIVVEWNGEKFLYKYSYEV